MDENRIGQKQDWTKSFGPKPVGRKGVGQNWAHELLDVSVDRHDADSPLVGQCRECHSRICLDAFLEASQKVRSYNFVTFCLEGGSLVLSSLIKTPEDIINCLPEIV